MTEAKWDVTVYPVREIVTALVSVIPALILFWVLGDLRTAAMLATGFVGGQATLLWILGSRTAKKRDSA